ncbi:hypothetical protein FRC09_017486, partial [Ceratobasidium sp. 395]
TNSKVWRGGPAFWRKKRYILLVLVFIGVVWTYVAYAPFQRTVRTKEHELQDLLQFFVAAPNESLPADLDPSAELSRKSLLAAAGGVKAKVPPVVVFSKVGGLEFITRALGNSYMVPVIYPLDLLPVRVAACDPVVRLNDLHARYSKRAKHLLASLHVEPPPFVVEVDLRSDANIVKALLLRLTGHGTFPNIIVQRKSLGGSDDLAQLHESGELVKVLAAAGAKTGTA